MKSRFSSGKKFLLLHFSFLIFHSALFAQVPNWQWAKGIGGTTDDFGLSVTTDTFGNVYTTGGFNGTVDFDPGPGIFNLTSTLTGAGDGCFIYKLDSLGNLVWAKAIVGQGDANGLSIVLDGFGNIYTTGVFDGLIDFDPGTSTFNLSAAGEDIFVSKLDGSGNFIWAKRMGGNSSVSISNSISVDISGNVYTTGYFNGTVDFDPGAGTFNLTSAGHDDVFISKLNSSGNFIWAKILGGANYDRAYSIALDVSCNVYTTGSFYGTADFDPGSGTFNLTSPVWENIFISKLDSSGNFLWAKTITGALSHSEANSIKIDSSGNIYTTGYFSGTVDFDPGNGIFNLNASHDKIFISKLDSSGNFAWAKAIGGVDNDRGTSIALDASGNIYTTGNFFGTIDFDPDSSGTFNLTAAYANISISKLDSAGNFIWANVTGGSGWQGSHSLALDIHEKVYLTGAYYAPSISFGSTNLINVDTNGNTTDIFIAKLDNKITGIENIENNNDILLFPNPATNELKIKSEKYKIKNIEIVDVLGQKRFTLNPSPRGEGLSAAIDVSQLEAGIYFVQITSADFIETKKLIIAK